MRLHSNMSKVTEILKTMDYGVAPEANDHVRIAPRYELFIGGKWVAPQSGTYFDTISPSTEQKLSEVAEADERDVASAVESARHAYDKYWSKLRPIERGKYLYRIARVLQEKARLFEEAERHRWLLVLSHEPDQPAGYLEDGGRWRPEPRLA